MSDIELDDVDKYHENRLKVSKSNKYQDDYASEDLSEEEVMGLQDDSESSDSDKGGEGEGEEEEEEDDDDENWGGKENIYGGDDLDEIDNKEEAEEFVKESIRLQKKHMEELNMEDFVDEDLMAEWKAQAENEDETLKPEKKVEDSGNFVKLSSTEKTEFIKATFPEYFPLCKELSDLYNNEFLILQKKIVEKNYTKVEEVKFIALSSYLGSIVNYINLLVSLMKNPEDGTLTMKDHPIMETILSSREVWNQSSHLKEIKEIKEIKDEDFDQTADLPDGEKEPEDEELEEELEEDDEEEEKADFAQLKKREIRKRINNKGSDEVEGDINDIDKEEKKSRKKSLRFYTSKIDQQALKKDAKFTGDEDIPYKERLFERQQRLVEEARKRGLDKSDATTNLDNNDIGSDDETVARNINDDYEDYYNSVKFAREDKRQKRKDAHQVAVKAAKEGKLAEIISEDGLGNDGKRAINYQIMKNKGLTVKRKKEVRNSRVKKRNKYDQAKKKLKSVRQVYQGQQSAYGGESTGIKKNLSRSVKFK